MIKNTYKGYYNIVKSESTKEATIYIYGIIGGWDFEAWKPINTADKFVKDFKAIENDFPIIHVKINSPGGNVWDGLPIYNTLKNSTSEIRTYVDGIAYSMASLIALAGDKVYGYSNSMLMFHNGSTYAYGNAQAMRNEADTLEKYDEALSSIIEEKLGITSEEAKEKYLNFSDNYFVGKAGKEAGFFDEIITTSKADVPEDIANMSPTDLMKHYGALNHAPNPQPKTATPKNSNQNIMNKLNVPLIEAAIGSPFSEGESEHGILLTDVQAKAIEALLASNAQAISDAATLADASAATISGMQAAATGLTFAVQEALEAAEVENASELCDVDGIAQLSALVAEYGANDGGKTSTPPASTDTDDVVNNNVISGVNLKHALNC